MLINFNPVNRFITFVALCLFVSQSASAQNAAAPSARQITAKVDEYMKVAVEVERFSGSILVARDGQAIISKSYGMANVELDVPNTPNTVFRLASITKQFTATAIMMLQERGKLNVNDSFCKYLTDCPAAWQPITIRQLLTMTGGIPNLTGPDLGPLAGVPVNWEQWLAAVKKKPLDFVPGEEFKYSNGGYTLLGFIIERQIGQILRRIFAGKHFHAARYEADRLRRSAPHH
ncbi:MAG: serine hydrolase domain-containing protein [Pyrinomonadaceae bacterium]